MAAEDPQDSQGWTEVRRKPTKSLAPPISATPKTPARSPKPHPQFSAGKPRPAGGSSAPMATATNGNPQLPMRPKPNTTPTVALGPSPLPQTSPRAYRILPTGSASDSDDVPDSDDGDPHDYQTPPSAPPSGHGRPAAAKMTPPRADKLSLLASDVIANAEKGSAAVLLSVGEAASALSLRTRVRRDAESAVARHVGVLRELRTLLLRYVGYTPLPKPLARKKDGTLDAAAATPPDADMSDFGLPQAAGLVYRRHIVTQSEFLDWMAANADMRQDAVILLSLQTPTLGLLLDTLSKQYRNGANDEVHGIRVGAAREALAWIERTPPQAVLTRLGWAEQGAGVAHLQAFSEAARNLVPDWAGRKEKISKLLWDLRLKNFPGVRMYQRSQVWEASLLLDKEKEYHDGLRAKGWVMTRDDVNAALKEAKTKFKKEVHGVKSEFDNVTTSVTSRLDGVQSEIKDVNTTVTSRLDGVQSEIKDVNTTVTTRLDGVQSDVDTLKTNFASILAAIAASQPKNKKLQTIVNAVKL
ncbi:hypothetical protein DFH27DRAFT_618573 [Peziza echinospora]|nr:hypothetical protein DFH27DRAFT_618573 [Peziza echinospora]